MRAGPGLGGIYVVGGLTVASFLFLQFFAVRDGVRTMSDSFVEVAIVVALLTVAALTNHLWAKGMRWAAGLGLISMVVIDHGTAWILESRVHPFLWPSRDLLAIYGIVIVMWWVLAPHRTAPGNRTSLGGPQSWG